MNLPPIANFLPPIVNVLSDIEQTLNTHHQVILQAPPGAGKSTFLPLKLLQHSRFANKKILMLEPRRLAARNIASFIASQLNEPVGKTVGYRVKGEHKISKDTRLEIITEGILARMLQQDPELEDVALIIFDEYHERSIHADTALAFCLEIQDALRDDLSLLIMSATLDSAQLSAMLPSACVITSQGRSYPVTTHYRPRNSKMPLPPQVANLVTQALTQYDGNILVFLPGASEINKVASLLNNLPSNTSVYPLYSQLKQHAQDAAINSVAKGQRKIVLATNIAETSLTIEGISLVIDSGLVNKASFNRNNGVTKLSKEQISQASATQREGRAGRLQAGHCWRMWPQEQQARLAAYDIPEIEQSDLMPLALELAKWGVTDVNQLSWLNQPPSHNLNQARQLLIELGAIDSKYQLTKHGESIYQFGTAPRHAHMMLWAQQQNKSMNMAATAALLAAMLEQTNALSNDLDISAQLNTIHRTKNPNKAVQQLITQANKYARQLSVKLNNIDSEHCGLLLAQAYPDRIAKRRDNSERFLLANGFGAALPEHSHFPHQYIIAADLMTFSAQRSEGRIFLAAAIDIDELEQLTPHHFNATNITRWDNKQDKVLALSQLKVGQLIIKQTPLTKLDQSMLDSALVDGIRAKGLSYLDFSKSDTQLLQRLQFAHQSDSQHWPDYSEKTLLSELDDWLVPYFNGAKKLNTLKQINLTDALLSRLDYSLQQQLNQQYPTHHRVASGTNVRLDYSDLSEVKLSVRIQELFGTVINPTVGRTKIPVLIEMLSPAQRPIQLTKDLVNFWHGSYEHVKKDMKGQYPRHYWPDNPSIAMPTTKTKKKMGL